MTDQAMRGTALRDGAMLLLAAAIFGGIFPVNRLAAEAAWPPMSFVLLQAAIAGVAVLAVVLATGQRMAVSRAHLLAYVVIGGLVLGLPSIVLVRAAEHLDASVLTLVLCLSPILTLLIGAAAARVAPDRMTLLGMLLGVAGIALIATPDTGVLGGATMGWFLIALSAPVMFALANNCAAWLRPPAAPSAVMAAGTLLGGAAVALVVTLVSGAALLPPDLGGGRLLPLVLATLIQGVFYYLFFWLINQLGPARFSLFNYVAVAAGIIWSMLAFGEQPAALFWVATALMLLGMHLALRPRG